MKRPRPLRKGERIAILSPASIINPDFVEGAARTIAAMGYEPVVMPHTLGKCGSYSGTREERVADLTEALTDPSIRAILCSRGGYGAVHLLSDLEPLIAGSDPKWLIGFSDISALHALLGSQGIVSVHSSMAKQLAKGADTLPVQRLFTLLEGSGYTLQWSSPEGTLNRAGEFTGLTAGGNLAVVDGLAATRFDPLLPGRLLIIEDIAEPIYKVERILYRLKISGVLDRLGALVVGRFTEYHPDRNYASMEAMIADMTAGATYPVAFGAPIGHIEENMPFLLNAPATLRVTPTSATLAI